MPKRKPKPALPSHAGGVNPSLRLLRRWQKYEQRPWHSAVQLYLCLGFPMLLLVLAFFVWMESMGGSMFMSPGEWILTLAMILGILGPGVLLMTYGIVRLTLLSYNTVREKLVVQDRLCFKCGAPSLFGGKHVYRVTYDEDERLEPAMHAVEVNGRRVVLCEACLEKSQPSGSG